MTALTLGPFDDFGVLGAGTAFPSRTLSNLEVLQRLPAEAWGNRARVPDPDAMAFAAQALEQTLGVKERAWAHELGQPLDPKAEQTTLDLAKLAAQRALTDAHLEGKDLGLVLVASSTPHRMTSTLSAPLGSALGTTCPCMDLRTGCAAGLFALGTAGLFHQAGAKHVLLVGAETFSKVIPPLSKMAAVSLGDGAGALVLGKVPHAKLSAVSLDTDGSLAGLVFTDGALPPTADEVARGGYLLSGNPEALRQAVPDKYAAAIAAVLARAKTKSDQLSHYVPHQTSRDVIAEVCKRLELPFERAYLNLHRHANIGAAGWLVALAEARAEGRLKRGDQVLQASVGGGMSWAAALWSWA